MDTESAFFAEIVADPLDDSSWLVLADWFEDHQQPFRAEIVRLSVWLRRHEAGPDRARHEQRWRELLDLGVVLPLPRRRLVVGYGVIGIELIFVPPGRYLMGSPPSEARRDSDEGPVHPVTISRGFWISTNLVTQGHWQALFRDRPPGLWRGYLFPVEGVSWFDCQGFLERLSRQHDLPFRLPTEAEWEYACRSLTTTPFFFGTTLSCQEVNFDGNYPYGNAAIRPWHETPTQIASFAPNAFGLNDMHGNVWEWCQDWYADDYYAHSPEIDPRGPADGTLRVLRGGSWFSYSWSCRCANREPNAPETGDGHFGFRVVLGG